MIYLFLDADEYLVSRRIADLKKAMGDPEMADLNLSRVDGARSSASDLLYQVSTIPFLAERRMVVADGYLSHLDKRMGASKGTDNAAYAEAAQLLRGLTTLPDSCDLLFVDGSVDKRRHLWRGFTHGSDGGAVPGLAALAKQKVIGVEELNTPDPRQLPGWIQRQSKQMGVAIDGRAVQMLANFVGSDLRRLENELDKLAAYADGRPINADDVRLLVSDASEAIIWDLTDALSRRNGKKAMVALHQLRQSDANPFYLLTMIARQYRILLKVKDAQRSSGGSEYDIAKRVGESPYPVKKAMQQTGAYGIEELEQILDRLLDVDYAMKSGADPETEIDVLVAELTMRPQSLAA